MTRIRLRQPDALRVSIILLSFITVSRAFSFSFTNSLSQCSQVTAQWNGGQPPFTLLLVPTGHITPETRTIIQENIPSGNSVSFTLNYPAQSQFVAVLSDATGIGTGGTSVVTTVGSSSDSSCLNTQQVSPKFFLFQSPSSVSQCANIDLSVGSQAQAPIDILGIVPGGQSFDIANLTNGATSFSWQANVRSGTNILFVAGDKDGLGSGGSTDVMSIGNGDSICINSQSPSSTAGPAAGGVSTAASGGSPTAGGGGGGQTTGGGGTAASPSQTGGGSGGTGTGTNGQNPTGTGGTNSPGSGGNPTGTGANGGPGGTGGGGGASGTGGGSPGQTGSGGQNDPGSSNFPGSGGGTVTGSAGTGTNGKHNNAGLIAGLVIAALALLGLIVGGVILYRRRARRANHAYNNLEHNAVGNGGNINDRPPNFPQVVPHLRGGAGSTSTDTLHSMFQTEPFILPAEYNPYVEHDENAPLTQNAQGWGGTSIVARPSLAVARAVSSSRSNYLHDVPLSRDAIGGALLGMHDGSPAPTRSAAAVASTDRKDSIGPHGEPPSRTPSGRPIPPSQRAGNRGMPPPISTERPTRVARDSEDFSPISPDEVPSPGLPLGVVDPFGDDQETVDIPPTYHSVQAVAASRQNSVMSHAFDESSSAGHGAEVGHDVSDAWVPPPSPMTRTLSRSNAISQSRRTRTRRSTTSFQGFRSDDGAHMGQ